MAALRDPGLAGYYIEAFATQRDFFAGSTGWSAEASYFPKTPTVGSNETWLFDEWIWIHPPDRQDILRECCTILGLPVPEEDIPDREW